jgi:hypothetical protein
MRQIKGRSMKLIAMRREGKPLMAMSGGAG